MRTVGDIVEAVQEQQPVTDTELRYTLLCLNYALQLSCPSDFNHSPEFRLRQVAKANFERWFNLLRTEPAEYLGPNWTPGTPENQEQREQSKEILGAFQRSQD